MSLGRRSVASGHRRDRDLWFQLQKTLLADSLDVHQFLDLLERPVLLAVLENLCRRLLADAGQRGEILEGGRIQVDGTERLGSAMTGGSSAWRGALGERMGSGNQDRHRSD